MAVRLDAQNEGYYATTGLPALNGEFTFTFWALIEVDRNTLSMFVSVQDNDVGEFHTTLGTESSGTDLAILNESGTTGPLLALTVGTWYRFAFTSNTSNLATAYCAPPGTALTALGTSTHIGFTPARVRIGQYTTGSGFWLDGRVAALKAWNSLLTLNEIENELQQYKPIRTANLQRFHPFVNAETVDYSGNGNTLTVVGTPTTETGPPIRWDGRLRGQLILPAPTAPALVPPMVSQYGGRF